MKDVKWFFWGVLLGCWGLWAPEALGQEKKEPTEEKGELRLLGGRAEPKPRLTSPKEKKKEKKKRRRHYALSGGKPTVSAPLVAVTPVPQSRFHLDVGYGRYRENHQSAAFALGYEYADPEYTFGFNMRLPFGLADSTFMLGDMAFRFRWELYGDHMSHTYLSLGFELTLPTVLLNTLGGSRSDIMARRTTGDLSKLYNGSPLGWNLFPMQYLQIGPQVAFAQKVGPVTLGAHLLASMILASRFRNLYDSPHVEFYLAYDLFAVYNILGNQLFEVLLEFGGVSFVTERATNEGATEPAGTGLTFTLGLQSRFAKRFQAALGFQIGLPPLHPDPSNEKRGFDLTTIYRHDWAILFRFGVLL